MQLENGMPTLEACPFCGSLGAAVIGFGVHCGTCGAVGPFGPTEEEAARRWNKRAPVSPVHVAQHRSKESKGPVRSEAGRRTGRA